MHENVFSERNPKTGLIETIDIRTGAVLSVQRNPYPTLEQAPPMVPYVLPTGETILVQKGLDLGLLANTRAEPFSQVLVDLVCQKISEGGSLTNICKEDGMPRYTTICRWRRAHPHVSEQLEQSRKDRAEYLRDMALQEAEGAESRDPIGAHSLRVDTYKWAAGVDESKYSPKAKIEASINTPTQIIISTGINREPREVTNAPDKEQVATALPDSTRAAAPTSQGHSEEYHNEVRTVSEPAHK